LLQQQDKIIETHHPVILSCAVAHCNCVGFHFFVASDEQIRNALDRVLADF
jgi:hypothetical protein